MAKTSKSSDLTNNKADSQRIEKILSILAEDYTDDFEGLDYQSPFHLLIATILAAQCTDERVNKVTATLFKKYLTPQDFILVPADELEEDIRSTGFYKAKAKNIRVCCSLLIQQFDGNVPGKLEELIQLGGVGRKTANVVLSHCFGKQAITVDTHVTRLSNLLGFVATTNAEKIEIVLMEICPENLWNEINRLFITHGRAVCVARRPKCSECRIAELCPSASVI